MLQNINIFAVLAYSIKLFQAVKLKATLLLYILVSLQIPNTSFYSPFVTIRSDGQSNFALSNKFLEILESLIS